MTEPSSSQLPQTPSDGMAKVSVPSAPGDRAEPAPDPQQGEIVMGEIAAPAWRRSALAPGTDSMATPDAIEAAAKVIHHEHLKPRKPSSQPPLVLLHGWGQALASLHPLAERLCMKREIHLLDLPGFGGSPWSGEDWDTRDYALCVMTWLREHLREPVARFDVLGHSFGGRIALRIASEWPDAIHRMMLVAAAGIPRQRSAAEKLRLTGVRALGKLCRVLPGDTPTAWHRHRFGSSDYQSAGNLRATLIKTVTEDQTPHLGSITARTLLLWGENDAATPVEIAHRFYKLIADTQLEVLPDRDHFPFAGAGVHSCAQVIDEFLAVDTPNEVAPTVAPQEPRP